MTIKLYNNQSDPLVLDKVLTQVGSAKTATPCDSISVESPVLILSDLEISNISKVNYMYITDLNRYYHCRLVMDYNGIYTAYGDVDPYMSFKSSILALTCIVDSQVTEKNTDINDGSKISQVNGFIQRINFNDSFNGFPTNILICAGGGQAPASP